MKNIQAIRGMNDQLPEEARCWSLLESIVNSIARSYGYKEIRLPLVEFTALFTRTIGEVTDIVEKEMYTFADRNGDSLTLRPEGTASCVRAGIEHGLLYNQVQRFFYCGPMFRHERPQKGRYRQFHQFGFEAFGLIGPDIDVEMLLLTSRIWKFLRVENKIELQINTLGNAASRERYREILVDYLNNNHELLDEDSKRRLSTNPLRVLDSKNPALKSLLDNAPKILDCLDDSSRAHFSQLCSALDTVGLKYIINPRLVRGLDYYCNTVFEWVTTELGSQGTICAGGHYDGLVEQLGGKATPAIGCALGVERLAALACEYLQTLPDLPLIYLVLFGEKASLAGMLIAEQIRNGGSVRLLVNCSGGNLGSQLKRADKSGAQLAFILGDEELSKGLIVVKYLREDREQETIKVENIENFLKNLDKHSQ